jgi:hypothetical protein
VRQNESKQEKRSRFLPTSLILLTTVWIAVGVLFPQTSYAGTVSGTVYDTDYLRAQAGGFEGVSHPRYTSTNGDSGQMVYPSNVGNLYRNASFAFVLDTDSGNTTPLQPVFLASPNSTTQDEGRYTFSFPFLSPGQHRLVFVESYRGEVYLPSSKRITITVPPNSSAVTGDFRLLRQWRLGNPIASIAPKTNNYMPINGVSADYLNGSLGYVAVSTYDGTVPGFYGKSALDIYRTVDGGQTWQKRGHIPAPVVDNFGAADVGYLNPPQFGVHFTDANHGVVMGQVNWNFFLWGNGLIVFTTDDGGETWNLSGSGGLTAADWSNPSLTAVNSTLISGSIQFVNDFYNSYTNEVIWDPSNRLKGILYGTANIGENGSNRLYTRVTNDGGRTWQNGKSLNGGPDVGAETGTQLQFFVFNGGNFATLSNYSTGTFLSDTASAWLPLKDTLQNSLTTPSGPLPSAGRASGQSAVSLLQPNSGGSPHMYRTGDGGTTWTQLTAFNGGDGYGGSLQHSFSFLAQMATTTPDGGLFLWDTSQDGQVGRSVDTYRSRTTMGALGSMLTYSSSHSGVRDVSPSFSTGRRVLLMDPATNPIVAPTVLPFSFDEEAATGPSRIVPLMQFVGPHFNADSGFYVNLVNTGGDWAKDITIDSVTPSNGVTINLPQPLPWNLGALPPGSTTGQIYDYSDPGIVFFTLKAVPAGVTRYSVLLAGHTASGQQFQTTVYVRP